MGRPNRDESSASNSDALLALLDELSLSVVILDAELRYKQTLGQLLNNLEQLVELMAGAPCPPAQTLVSELTDLCHVAIMDEAEDGDSLIASLNEGIDRLRVLLIDRPADAVAEQPPEGLEHISASEEQQAASPAPEESASDLTTTSRYSYSITNLEECIILITLAIKGYLGDAFLSLVRASLRGSPPPEA